MILEPYLKKIKVGIFISGLCVFAQLYLFQALLPEVCHYYNIDISHSSWTVSLATLGMATGLFFFAFQADAMPRKKIMVQSIIGASLLTIITPWMPHFYLVLMLCFLKGMILSGVTAVALAYISEEVKLTHLGIVIGLYLSGNTVGGMMGRTGVLLISHYYSWQYAVTAIGVFCLLLGGIFYATFPSSRNFTPNEPIYKLKRLKMFIFLKDKQLLSLYFLAAIIMSCFVAIYNLISFELIHVYQLSPEWVACIFLMYLVGVYASMLAGKWADKYLNQNILWKLLVVYLIGITFAFFAAHTIATKLVSQRVATTKSTATSLYWLFYYVGSSLMGFFASWLYEEWGWSVLLSFLVIVLLIGWLLSWNVKKYYKAAQ